MGHAPDSMQGVAEDRFGERYRHQQWLERSSRPYVDPIGVTMPERLRDLRRWPRRHIPDQNQNWFRTCLFVSKGKYHVWGH
jgi:hypothetical protein